MNDLYDVLEICLQELENGADVESVLARYPGLASELRPILKASINARSAAVSAPSPEVMRRGRAKLLQRAAEMREAKNAPRKRMIPLFQRLAISFTMTALFLASGTGLVGASSNALPGENLYPVKLTWESLRLFFTFDHKSRELLEHSFENERLHEINELFAEGRPATIQFTGVFMEANGQTYVSGIRIMILDTTILPADGLTNGAAVIVTGRTNAEGFVDAESIELLPAGTIVPAGPTLQVEPQKNENGNDNVNDNGNDNHNDNGNDNSNGNENSNSNENGNDNSNVNDNGNDNGNSNDNGDDGGNSGNANDNVNDNGNDNGNTNDNANDNSNVNDNSNDNSNGNDNVNSNTNDNVNDNGNTNVNDNGNGNDNGNDNGNTNDNDGGNGNGNDNGNDNDSGGGGGGGGDGGGGGNGDG
jgi:uncharacterized membrane protein YgcG